MKTATTGAPETLSRRLRQGAQERFFTGACAALARDDGSALEWSAGDTGCRRPRAVSPACLFDLASLTKPIVTTIALRLVTEGALELEQPLRELLPASACLECGDCTVTELLAHESGLPAFLPLYERIPDDERGTARGAAQLLELTLKTPLDGAQRGTAVYSDLGFILLGAALEEVTAQSLDALVRSYIGEALGLSTLHYRPLGTPLGESELIAATEPCPWRHRLLVGEVHDDNTWTAGGVSGQAGLFGTALDVARFGALWLQWCRCGGWLHKALASLAIARRSSGRALGWDCRSASGSSAGSLFGQRTFGHLGFTGCSLWIDPELGISVALLTNRVRFGRSNDALKAFRPAFHDAVVTSLG
ncbi:MAG: beta-lactamase family protein [Myxococcota bacterium]|nr:beta-lactamase family protein [Myxococcota bacterium]